MTSRAWCLPLALLLAAGCSGTEPTERFYTSMIGSSEIPPNGSTSSGTVAFVHRGDALDYTVVVQLIVGVKSVGLFAGPVDSTAPKVADLYTGPVTGAIASGILVSGTLTASSFTGISMDSALVLMRLSHASVNVGTASLPNGEIRGVIVPN
ncbi:MAG: CHRD domain-containing protein [Gemmatimonadales bacterium]